MLNRPQWILTVEWDIDGKTYRGIVDRLVQAGPKNIGLRVVGLDGQTYFVNPFWLKVVSVAPIYPYGSPAQSGEKPLKRRRNVYIIRGRRWLKEFLDLRDQEKLEAVTTLGESAA